MLNNICGDVKCLNRALLVLALRLGWRVEVVTHLFLCPSGLMLISCFSMEDGSSIYAMVCDVVGAWGDGDTI